jgi:hypothetical protein
MTDQKETLWAVSTNSDLTEGRGRQYTAHFCKLRATAIRLAKGQYVQGGNCPVSPVEVLVLDGKRVLPMSLINVIYPTKDDEVEEMRIAARVAALEKAKAAGLTDDDIKLLGGKGQ